MASPQEYYLGGREETTRFAQPEENMVLIFDTSSSMCGNNTVRFWNTLAKFLENCPVTIIFFNSTARVVENAVLLQDDSKENTGNLYFKTLKTGKDCRYIDGETFYSPMKSAYDAYTKSLSVDTNCKVLMVTDGCFNGNVCVNGQSISDSKVSQKMLNPNIWANFLMIRFHTSGTPDTKKLLHMSTEGHLFNLLNIKSTDFNEDRVIEQLQMFKNAPILGDMECNRQVTRILNGDRENFDNIRSDVLKVTADRLLTYTLLPRFDKTVLCEFLDNVLKCPQINVVRHEFLRKIANVTGTINDKNLADEVLQRSNFNDNVKHIQITHSLLGPSEIVDVMPFVGCPNKTAFRIVASHIQGDFTVPLPTFCRAARTPDERAIEIHVHVDTDTVESDIFLQIEAKADDVHGKLSLTYCTTHCQGGNDFKITPIPKITPVDTVKFSIPNGGIYCGVSGDLKITHDQAVNNFIDEMKFDNFQQAFVVLLRNDESLIKNGFNIISLIGIADMQPGPMSDFRTKERYRKIQDRSRNGDSKTADKEFCLASRVSPARVLNDVKSTTASSYDAKLQKDNMDGSFMILVKVYVNNQQIQSTTLQNITKCDNFTQNARQISCKSNEKLPTVQAVSFHPNEEIHSLGPSVIGRAPNDTFTKYGLASPAAPPSSPAQERRCTVKGTKYGLASPARPSSPAQERRAVGPTARVTIGSTTITLPFGAKIEYN
jgi:hypothetical protein